MSADIESQAKSFAFESTLASQSLARRLRRLKAHGYRIHILFLWLPTPDLAIARVAERVRAGGHDVPPDAVRRRFSRGRRNFLTVYRPVADTWRLYDGSSISGPRLIASGAANQQTRVRDRETWRIAFPEYTHE